MVFSRYRRKQIAELRPYQPGESLFGVSVSTGDREAGSPKAGDMIARNPKDHTDQWLVAAQYFADHFEPVIDAALGARFDAALEAKGATRAAVVPAVCNVCGRAAVLGEKLGETCGAPVPVGRVRFEALTEAEAARELDRIRAGVPQPVPGSTLCYGLLVSA